MKLIGAEDILARGVTSFAQLRPVLAGNADPIASNATLRMDEWREIDARVNDVMRERLTIVEDLRAAGLVTTVSLGTILRVTERQSDFDAANVSFDGDTDPLGDRPNYKRDVIPVPVISKDFRISWRQLEASRKRNEPLDTSGAAIATRKVRDKLANVFYAGWATGPGSNPTSGTDGQSIPGLVNGANRLTQAKSGSWSTAATDIIADVLATLGVAYGKNLFGPFNLYVAKNAWSTLQGDYKTANPTSRTFLERILGMADIKAVRPLDQAATDNHFLVQMTEDVIDLTEAQAVTTVQWEKNPFVNNFRVLEVGGPQIKNIEVSDGTTIMGYVHIS